MWWIASRVGDTAATSRCNAANGRVWLITLAKCCDGCSMRLIGSNTSPYVRKARLVLLEKRIPHTYVLDPPSEPNSQVTRFNPLGRIPALILDDGTCVFDSPVIADYADTLNDTPILIPRHDALARMERIRPAEKQEPANIDLHNGAITRAVEHFAGQLGHSGWCEGNSLTLG